MTRAVAMACWKASRGGQCPKACVATSWAVPSRRCSFLRPLVMEMRWVSRTNRLIHPSVTKPVSHVPLITLSMAGVSSAATSPPPSPPPAFDPELQPPSERARYFAEVEAARTLLDKAKRDSNGQDDHPLILDAFNRLAAVYHRAGDRGNELKTLEELEPLAIRLFGDLHANSLMVRARRLTAARDSDPQAAVAGLTALQEKFATVFGAEHECTLSLVHAIAGTHHFMSQYEEERKLLEALLPRIRRALGESHMGTCQTVLCLSRALGYLDQPEASRQLLVEHLTAVKPSLGPSHPHVLQVGCGLALVHAVLEEFEAESALRESLAPYMAAGVGKDSVNYVLSEGHRAVAAWHAMLARLRTSGQPQQPPPLSTDGCASPSSPSPAAAIVALTDADRSDCDKRVQVMDWVGPSLDKEPGAMHSDTVNLMLRYAEAMTHTQGYESRGEALFQAVMGRVGSGAGGADGPHAALV